MLFINFYFIYEIFEIYVFKIKQGSKIEKKKQLYKRKENHNFKSNKILNLVFNYKAYKDKNQLIYIQKILTKIIRNLIFILLFIITYNFLMYFIFIDIIQSKYLEFPIAFRKVNLINEYPEFWNTVKFIYYINNIVFSLIISILTVKRLNKIIYSKNIKSNNKNKENIAINDILDKNKFKIVLGVNEEKNIKYINENSAFKNILVTGSIGSGKTSSAMYNFTDQLIKYKFDNINEKIGMLILDVKGNYYDYVKRVAKKYGRESDVICIDDIGNVKYNILDKPELKPQIIANRLKQIFLLFSPNNSESFWIDKSEQIIAEVINFIKLYNDNYVNFNELYKIINNEEYYELMKEKVKNELVNLTEEEIYNFRTFIEFYENEYNMLDDRTKNIIKAEISRVINVFISDYKINKNFSPEKNEVNFYGFKEVIEKGKIVVLNMNIAKYRDLSKIIATYLKFDFQSEVLMQLQKREKSDKKIRMTAFLCDEYQEYVTKNDGEFYAQSREAKCINIVSTQSYSSIKDKLKDKTSADLIIQNLVNKIWFRTDDEYTITKAQKAIGKEEKKKESLTIGESGNNANYNYLSKNFMITNTNLSESLNQYSTLEYKYDTKYFNQELSEFEAVCFYLDNDKKYKVEKLKLIPYFLNKNII